jgi:hypothetical protein
MFPRIRICHTFALLLLSLLLAGCTTMWKEKPTAWSNATGVEQFERLFWQDVKDKNWSDVEAHLASNYVYQSSGALRDHDAALEHFKKLEIADYTLGDVQVHFGGLSPKTSANGKADDLQSYTVIVTYTMDLKGTYEGQPLALSHVRMMSVWQQQKKSWETIAHADSPQ